jgi:hypothetical protein
MSGTSEAMVSVSICNVAYFLSKIAQVGRSCENLMEYVQRWRVEQCVNRGNQCGRVAFE